MAGRHARGGRRSWHLAALVIATVLWGTSTALTKYALDAFAPITLLFVELVIANLVLWPVLALRRGLRRPPELRRLALLGLLEPTLTYGGLTVGLATTSAANASLLGSFEAPFVVLLAVLVLRERLTGRRLAGMALAVGGVAVLDGVRQLFALSVGDLLILGGALAAAVYTLLASDLAGRMDPLEMTTYQFGFGLLFTTPVAVVLWLTGHERLSPQIEARQWAVVVLIGVTEFIVSFLLFNYAVRAIPAAVTGMTLNLIPVFGVLAAVVLLGERLAIGQAAGAILIIGGMLLFSEDEGDPAPVGDRSRTRHRRYPPVGAHRRSRSASRPEPDRQDVSV